MNEFNKIGASRLQLEDTQLNVLLEQGFVVLEQACEHALFTALQQESQQLEHAGDEFKDARLIAGQLNAKVRSDHTRWLQVTDPAGAAYLATLENLANDLNYQLYSGIRRVEAHYAVYGAGDFYKLHRDNPTTSSIKQSANRQVRVFSTVFYLNPEWHAAWQGELHLQDLQQQWHLILPMPNRLVIFQSNLLHEVRPATHERRSIAGWLRQDDGLV